MLSEDKFMVYPIIIIHIQYKRDHSVPGLSEK